MKYLNWYHRKIHEKKIADGKPVMSREEKIEQEKRRTMLIMSREEVLAQEKRRTDPTKERRTK
jgi:hypothetical protein